MTEPAVAAVGGSAEAERLIDAVRAGFVLRADASPALGASAATGFLSEGTALTPILPPTAADLPLVSSVRLPAHASEPLSIDEVRSVVGVRASLVGAEAVPAQVAGGFVVYPAALGGADVIHRLREDGVEDYVRFAVRPTTPELRYRVVLGDRVAGIRLVAGTLEVLDAGGVPRLRVGAPYLVDAAGTIREAHLAVEGCAYDSDPRAPWGRPVVAPGASMCAVTVRWSEEGLSYPILVDPSWTTTGSMNTARQQHGASVLPSGDVLVAGGLGSGATATNKAEIYSASSHTWSVTASMTNSRYSFGTASVSDGTTTYILAAGGNGNCTGGPYCNQAERYNTATGVWGSAGTMADRRAEMAIGVLTDGSGKAIVSGGINGSGVLATAALYDPVGNSWTATASMGTARYGHGGAALSPSHASDFVVVGGLTAAGAPIASAEKYDPVGMKWSSAGSMIVGRYGHTVSLLAGDYVLAVAGQYTSTGSCIRRIERYDPAAGTWSSKATVPGSGGLCFQSAAKLDDGTILIAGGRTASTGTALNGTFTYDPIGDAWTTRPSLATARYSATATTYPSSPVSKVVVAAGAPGPLSSAEYYTP